MQYYHYSDFPISLFIFISIPSSCAGLPPGVVAAGAAARAAAPAAAAEAAALSRGVMFRRGDRGKGSGRLGYPYGRPLSPVSCVCVCVCVCVLCEALAERSCISRGPKKDNSLRSRLGGGSVQGCRGRQEEPPYTPTIINQQSGGFPGPAACFSGNGPRKVGEKGGEDLADRAGF